jgi:hypothetical protein
MNNNTPQSIDPSADVPRPTMVRTMSMPNNPKSPLANNPWYRQKFEFVCQIIVIYFICFR